MAGIKPGTPLFWMMLPSHARVRLYYMGILRCGDSGYTYWKIVTVAILMTWAELGSDRRGKLIFQFSAAREENGDRVLGKTVRVEISTHACNGNVEYSIFILYWTCLHATYLWKFSNFSTNYMQMTFKFTRATSFQFAGRNLIRFEMHENAFLRRDFHASALVSL